MLTVFVQVGSAAAPPAYMYDAIKQAQLWGHRTHVVSKPGLSFHIFAARYPHLHEFWLNTLFRFVVLAHWMAQEPDHRVNVLHVENDVMLYATPDEFMQTCTHPEKMTAPKDAVDRVVPSIVFFPRAETAVRLSDYLLKNLNESYSTDMTLLGRYPDLAVMPTFFPSFGSCIVDGAALGQYLGGCDPINHVAQRPFYNETCTTIDWSLAPTFTFREDETGRVCPYLHQPGGGFRVYRVLNLHVHCKLLAQFDNATLRRARGTVGFTGTEERFRVLLLESTNGFGNAELLGFRAVTASDVV